MFLIRRHYQFAPLPDIRCIMCAGDHIIVNTSNPELDKKIREWIKWDKNKETFQEVHALVKEGDVKKLSKLFLHRLQFGTAGLRAKMGAGFSQMNELVVIQTAQGLSQYLFQCFPDTWIRGILIGYDGRHNSRRFAELTAAVFLARKIKVYLFPSVCPTPYVAYGITKLRCVAGIMITASHNPKEDNGYKVYWRNGAQIIGPHDRGIEKCILDNLEPWLASWDTTHIFQRPNIYDPLLEIGLAYNADMSRLIIFPEYNEISTISIVYTPMHGVGYRFVKRAFKSSRLKDFYPVMEQMHPDPEFPTVEFPNPEEGRSALSLAMRTADEHNCTLILANDPDADRLAVAERKSIDDEEWKIFTGNELGALLGWYCFFCYKFENPYVEDFGNVYMLSSTVSSKIIYSMAKVEGFNYVETLTGFKWMGNVTDKLVRSNCIVLFAFEEAIGFMCGSAVLDKDGVSAAVKVAEMACFLKEKFNITLQEKLEEIYRTYGQHITLNSYYICHEQSTINAIFHRLRNFKEENDQSYPDSILNGKYRINGIRDLTTGYDDSYPDKKARLPSSKSSQMITFKFTNGLVATLRTSGTEPKLKYYSELCADPKEQDIGKLHGILHEMVDALVEEFLEPAKNDLIPRSD